MVRLNTVGLFSWARFPISIFIPTSFDNATARTALEPAQGNTVAATKIEEVGTTSENNNGTFEVYIDTELDRISYENDLQAIYINAAGGATLEQPSSQRDDAPVERHLLVDKTSNNIVYGDQTDKSPQVKHS